jgi:Carboxypeptidase regulatory-like domain
LAAVNTKFIGGFYRIAVLLWLWVSLPLIGQDCGITGHITDTRRAAVAGAVVTVTQEDSGLTRQVLSNGRGFFQAAPLPPGTYEIDVVKPGFRLLSRTGEELVGGSAAAVDLQMETGGASEPLRVEARRTSAGLLLAYVCGLSAGSGCEMFEPLTPAAQSDSSTLP